MEVHGLDHVFNFTQVHIVATFPQQESTFVLEYTYFTNKRVIHEYKNLEDFLYSSFDTSGQKYPNW